ncbi:hypothetical protein [Neisseria perflava]|uniref:hypothetical protein n=1 Tax=Neisseria perflava TaxID=33053 RepID=UPI00209CF980|nr:hypothetical protein [Neisseria perflava]MCP1659392.1 PBP1b-binding outer membrane lipoprotein LpoB [Neisseria perflava]MCP1772165.1 PBP1b-binding outer membrane lipoprotein LpoB [Neisseria perflava]
MKTLLISIAASALLLTACASNKTENAPKQPQQISVEEALNQCKQAAGDNQDRATFDSCMKDKGFLRKSDAQAQTPAAAQ